MVFHEVYGNYFNVVAAILSESIDGTLDDKRMYEIIQEKAFGESVLSIPEAIKAGDWGLLGRDCTTMLKHKPTRPLTTLQKRWLKSLLQDPRIRLFSPKEDGLEDVEPLYRQEDIVYFDRYGDGDPYEDEQYVENFRLILRSFREKRKIRLDFVTGHGKVYSWFCIPWKLEYSDKDDKFRFITFHRGRIRTINVARINTCSLGGGYTEEEFCPPEVPKEELVFEIRDDRNALERVMHHFSHYKKETEKLGNNRYRMILHYYREDETEVLIRIISFGPMIRVVAPESFVDQIRERLEKQKSCE